MTREELMEQAGTPNVHTTGRCLKCRESIVAFTTEEWAQAMQNPSPHCGSRHW